jgi:Protein of unknown function (DUF3987)
MKRHVWINRGSFKLYPNMFTVLVGRAGIGKGAAMGPLTSLLEESGSANLLSDRLTIEYILEKLSKGFPSTTVGAGGIHIGTDSSATIISPELSILITASLSTLPILADLWDARDRDFSYGTRHKGEYKIKSPCVTILGASTPEWLISSIPSNAIGGGFTRRVNFVYAKKRSKTLPWPSMNHSQTRASLVNDLRRISMLQGEFGFAKDAEEVFEKLYEGSEPDDYDDEATTAYKTSKWAHALKLAMCVSASRGDDRTITRADMTEAATKVDEIGKDVPMVFRAVGESDLAAAAERVLRQIEDRGFITFEEIMRINWRHVSMEDAQRLLLSFQRAGLVREVNRGTKVVYEAIPQVQTKGGKP